MASPFQKFAWPSGILSHPWSNCILLKFHCILPALDGWASPLSLNKHQQVWSTSRQPDSDGRSQGQVVRNKAESIVSKNILPKKKNKNAIFKEEVLRHNWLKLIEDYGMHWPHWKVLTESVIKVLTDATLKAQIRMLGVNVNHCHWHRTNTQHFNCSSANSHFKSTTQSAAVLL